MSDPTSSADQAERPSGLRSPAPIAQEPSDEEDTSPSMIRRTTAADTSVSAADGAAKRGSVAGSARSAPGAIEPGSAAAARPVRFERLGHYEIVGQLGGGGMGEVFKGYEPALDRHVAIKVLSPTLARDEEFVRRFHREAASAAQLVHPHVVQIFYIGEDQGHHFFAMQYVHGESLAERLDRRHELPLDESLALVEQLLSGLAAAHRIDLVHRDIKPGNLLIDVDHDRLLLTDFGLVKALGGGGRSTTVGVVMGTVEYIAPEQGAGRPVDARADLYSVGVLMYRLLGGRLPFEADTPTALLFKHTYEIPQPLCEVRPEIPEALSEIVDRLLAKSPGERPRSADELLAELRGFREQSQARRSRTGDGAGEPRSIVIQAPVFEDWGGPFGKSTAPSANGWWQDAQDRLATMFRRHAPGFLQDLRSGERQMDGAVAMYERRRRRLERLVEEAEDVLEQLANQVAGHRQAAAAASRRARSTESAEVSRRATEEKNREIRLADQLDEQVTQQQNEIESMRTDLAKVQAGLAQFESQRAVLHARMRTAKAKARLAGGRVDHDRPNCRRMITAAVCGLAALVLLIGGAWLSEGRFRIPNATLEESSSASGSGRSPSTTTGAFRTAGPDGAATSRRPLSPELAPATMVTTGPPLQCKPLAASIASLRFAAQSGNLFSSSSDAPLRLWDDRTGREKRRIGLDSPSIIAPSPRGSVVAAVGDNRTVRIWEVGSGREIWQFEVHRAVEVVDLDYSPDGQYLAGINFDTLWIRDTQGRPVRSLLCSDDDEFTCFTWSANGKRVLGGTKAGSLHIWDAASGQAVGTLDVTAREGPVVALAALADPRYCVTLHGRLILVWNVEAASQGLVLRDQPSGPTCIAASRDGRMIFAGDDGGSIHAWSTLTGHRLHVFQPATSGRVLHLAAAPDGSSIASATADRRLDLWSLEDIGPESFVNTAGMRLTLIPAGLAEPGFVAPGSPPAPGQHSPRALRIPRPYLMGAYEVTQQQFSLLMGSNPSTIQAGGSPDPDALDLRGRDTGVFPVENVSWHDAAEFCNRLSAAEKLPPYYRIVQAAPIGSGRSSRTIEVLGGAGYRLPTEVEWEYACRAGSRDRFPHGDQDISLADYAWIDQRRTDEVGQRKPNGFGLYDLLGNVAEYAHAEPPRESGEEGPASDIVETASAPRTGGRIVVRGGAAADPRDRIQPGARTVVEDESAAVPMTGFRLARDAPEFGTDTPLSTADRDRFRP